MNVFFGKRFSQREINETSQNTPIEKFTIQKKISPKKGRAVIFPGYYFHCGTTPRISKARIVMNINLKVFMDHLNIG